MRINFHPSASHLLLYNTLFSKFIALNNADDILNTMHQICVCVCIHNDLLKFGVKWMELENITLTEITQVQKKQMSCSHS